MCKPNIYQYKGESNMRFVHRKQRSEARYLAQKKYPNTYVPRIWIDGDSHQDFGSWKESPKYLSEYFKQLKTIRRRRFKYLCASCNGSGGAFHRTQGTPSNCELCRGTGSLTARKVDTLDIVADCPPIK